LPAFDLSLRSTPRKSNPTLFARTALVEQFLEHFNERAHTEFRVVDPDNLDRFGHFHDPSFDSARPRLSRGPWSVTISSTGLKNGFRIAILLLLFCVSSESKHRTTRRINSSIFGSPRRIAFQCFQSDPCPTSACQSQKFVG